MKAVTEDMAASTVAAVMTDCNAPGILSQPVQHNIDNHAKEQA
jgi:hypothetical protein